MPTRLPDNEKQAFISLVQAAPFPGGPQAAGRLQDILNNYEDIFDAVMRELEVFASNNGYLTQAMAVFNDGELMAAGIWNNKTISSPPLTDPVLIVNSNITNDTVLISAQPSPPIYQTLAILGNSFVQEVSLEANANLAELYIGPGVTVDRLDSSQPGAVANTVWLPYLKSTPSALNSSTYNSNIGQVLVDDKSYYGGQSNDDPDSACGTPVTNLTVQEITHNSVTLHWDAPKDSSPPIGFLFLNVYYRQSGSQVWLGVDSDIGGFIGDTGFVFTTLDKDTFYDFKVSLTCLNGGIADVIIYQQTVCCGPNSTNNEDQDFTAQGNTAFGIPAGSELHSISIFPVGDEIINIGTTPGGTDILSSGSVTPDGYVLIVDRTFSLTLQTTIYITGVIGVVTYRVIEL